METFCNLCLEYAKRWHRVGSRWIIRIKWSEPFFSEIRQRPLQATMRRKTKRFVPKVKIERPSSAFVTRNDRSAFIDMIQRVIINIHIILIINIYIYIYTEQSEIIIYRTIIFHLTTFTIIINDDEMVTVIKSRCDDSQLFRRLPYSRYHTAKLPDNAASDSISLRTHCVNESVLISLEILILLYFGYCRDRDASCVSFCHPMPAVCVCVCLCLYVCTCFRSHFVVVLVLTREFLISMYVTWHFMVPRSSIASHAREHDFRFNYTVLSAKRCEMFFAKVRKFSTDYQTNYREKIAVTDSTFLVRARKNW